MIWREVVNFWVACYVILLEGGGDHQTYDRALKSVCEIRGLTTEALRRQRGLHWWQHDPQINLETVLPEDAAERFQKLREQLAP